MKSVPDSPHYERVGNVESQHMTTDVAYLVRSDKDCEQISKRSGDGSDTVGVDDGTENANDIIQVSDERNEVEFGVSKTYKTRRLNEALLIQLLKSLPVPTITLVKSNLS